MVHTSAFTRQRKRTAASVLGGLLTAAGMVLSVLIGVQPDVARAAQLPLCGQEVQPRSLSVTSSSSCWKTGATGRSSAASTRRTRRAWPASADRRPRRSARRTRPRPIISRPRPVSFLRRARQAAAASAPAPDGSANLYSELGRPPDSAGVGTWSRCPRLATPGRAAHTRSATIRSSTPTCRIPSASPMTFPWPTSRHRPARSGTTCITRRCQRSAGSART